MRVGGDHGPDDCVRAGRCCRQGHRKVLALGTRRPVLRERPIRAVDADAAPGWCDPLREQKVDAGWSRLESDAWRGVGDNEPGVSRRGDRKERERGSDDPGEDDAPQ